MSLLHYIDNEPASGEWTSTAAPGASTIERLASASFPDRGSYGLRMVAGGDVAYVQKNSTHTIAEGESIFFGWWMKVSDVPASTFITMKASDGSNSFCSVYLKSNGRLELSTRTDAPSYPWTTGSELVTDCWHYVVVEARRANAGSNNGYYKLYVDGKLDISITGSDNDASVSQLGYVRFGAVTSTTSCTVDYDEIKIATTYPQPFTPTPTSDYLCPERICVICAPSAASSLAAADAVRSNLGVPLANLINTTYTATGYASYADYVSYITDVLDEVFANHPAVASNCMCFLLVAGVPHTFIESGTIYSVANWLMNYGGDSTPQLANPHYQKKTRLTKTALAGKYMAAVLAGDYTTQLLTGVATMAGLDELLDAETLFSDEASYLTSVPAQKLRIETSALGTYANDAFVFGDTGDVSNLSFGAAGARASFVDTSDGSTLHLEDFPGDETATVNEALNAGYLSGMGSTDTADTFDAETFFEVLRIGTFAEAAFAACEYLKSTATPVGAPTLTVPFQTKGYSVYHGLGGPEAIDWSTPVACIRAGYLSQTTQLTLAPGQKHVFGIRSISAAGIAEDNSHILTTAELDDQGNLLGSPLSKVTELTGRILADNSLRLEFSYLPMIGTDSPDSLEIYTDSGSGSMDIDNPISIATYIAGKVDFEVKLPSPVLPASFAVRAIRAAQPGPLSKSIRLSINPAPQGATVFQE